MPNGVPGMGNIRTNGMEKVAVLMLLIFHLESRVIKHLPNNIM